MGCEAAFDVFHFTGMLGVSEAFAEPVASTLKRYSPIQGDLATERMIERTILAREGVAGEGSDDLLILRSWAEYFGGMRKEVFSFQKKDRRSKLACRQAPLGRGCAPLHYKPVLTFHFKVAISICKTPTRTSPGA